MGSNEKCIQHAKTDGLWMPSERRNHKKYKNEI